MTWSGFLKSFSAFLVAIALLLGGGFFVLQYLIGQFTSPPPKPTFPNDQPSTPAQSASRPSPPPKPTAQPSPPTAVASPSASPSASPAPTASPSPQSSPANVYRARITISEGLNVRQGPGADTDRVSGVDYNQEVTVLEESEDKEWVKIRIDATGEEGWIKSGYTEKAE